jgi:hypothetical protein
MILSMIKKLLLLTILFPIFSFAGTGWYVTIINNTNENVTIEPGGNDNWYTNDLGQTQSLAAKETKTFYTEDHSVDEGIIGINIYYESRGLVGRAEFWENYHSYSVNCNIKQCHFCPLGDAGEDAHVGTSRYYLDTDLKADENAGYYGTVYATLILNSVCEN